MFTRLFRTFRNNHLNTTPRRTIRTRFRIEPLEDRLALSLITTIPTFQVNTADDTNFDHTILNDQGKVVNVVDANGNTSLRAVVEYGDAHLLNGAWNTNHYNVDLSLVAGQTITLKPNLVAGDNFQTLGLRTNFNFLANTGNVTIARPTAAGTPLFNLFGVSGDAESHFNNITMTNGNSVNDGGAVFNLGTLMFENCTFTNNSLAGSGGAIVDEADATTIASNCTFTNNSADDNGGAVAGLAGSLTNSFTNCTFTNNSAVANGGAISVIGIPVDDDHPAPIGSLYISGCSITGNWTTGVVLAQGLGGGVYIQDLSNASIAQTDIISNTAAVQGGLYVKDSDLIMTDGRLDYNIAAQDGGGFYIDADTHTATLNSVSVSLNTATNGKGGGGYLLTGTLAGNLAELVGNVDVGGFPGIRARVGNSTVTLTVPPNQQTVQSD